MAPSQLDEIASPLMYKNKLQEHTQKSGLPLPVYENINEGFHHAPKFRSTVLVDKTKYTSQSTFPDRRAAEQEAAKLAYEFISRNTKTEDFSSVYQFSSTDYKVLNFLCFLGSDSGTLAQIIKSKDKLYTALHGNKSSGNDAISNLAVQLDQHQKEENIQIAGLPSGHQGESIQAEVVSFGARPGRTANAGMTKRKIETNSWGPWKKPVA